jgi:hypothetical protein
LTLSIQVAIRVVVHVPLFEMLQHMYGSLFS